MLKFKKIRTKFLILSFGFTFLILNFTFPCFAQDKIIAIVNNDIITQKDLNDFITVTRIQLSEESSGKELETKIQSMKLDLLNKLIEDRLILQEAKKEKVQINEGMVKAKMNELKKRYPSETDLNFELSKQGLVEADLENKIREQFLMRSIVEDKVRSLIRVSPSEIAAFYRDNPDKFLVPSQREVQVIGTKDGGIAKQAYNDLKSGKTPEEVASGYSLYTDKVTIAQNGQLRKDVEDQVFNLQPGGVTAPIQVGDTYYIFKLNNIIPSRQASLSEAQEEIRDFIGSKKMQDELTKWIHELKEKAYIKISSS